MRLLALSFLLALLPALPARAAADLRVHVEPRVEIASVMARLAGYEEYQAAGLPGYDAAVQAHFEPFAGHPSIAVMRELRQAQGIGYGAPLELALLADRHWKSRHRLDPRPEWLDSRWDAASARRFLDAARRFDRDSGAQAFFDPRILLYESLVRAQTQRYLRAHGEAAVLARALAEDRGKGFPWAPSLAELLEAQASAGASMLDGAMAAKVAALLQDWARDDGARVRAEQTRLADEARARLQAGPQVLSYSPAPGARVAPGDGLLEVRFDRPMAPALSIFGEVPEVIGKPAWSEDGTTLRIPVRFAAGAAYRLLLNTEDAMKMRSRADEPLAPREWRFSAGD